MRKARLDKAQAGIKISGRKIKNLRYADDTTFMAESEEELKTFLMKVKEESEKAGLKFNIQQRSWHLVLSNHGKQMGKKKIETVTEFIFLGPKITVDGDCSHEIKRCFLLGRKAMTNIESILKSRDIALPTKVHIIKAFFFFPVVMLDKTLERVLWTARRSNQSVLKGIILQYSLEGLMLKKMMKEKG